MTHNVVPLLVSNVLQELTQFDIRYSIPCHNGVVLDCLARPSPIMVWPGIEVVRDQRLNLGVRPPARWRQSLASVTGIEYEYVGTFWNAEVVDKGFQRRNDVRSGGLVVPEAGHVRRRDVECVREKCHDVVGVRYAS